MRVLYICTDLEHHASVSSTDLSSFIDPEDEQGGGEGCTMAQEEEKPSLARRRVLPGHPIAPSCGMTLARAPP